MKMTTMLLAATAAFFAFQSTGASSQDACSKKYVSCMDACVTKQPQSFQGRCIESCQAGNNQCSEKIYGVRRESTTPTATAQQPPRAAKDALAKKEPPVAPEAQPAAQPQSEPAAHPQVQAVPAPQEEAPAPRKRAPAR